MANNIDYNGSDKWRQRATELLNQGGGGGGLVDDVKVNGTSVVDANKVAQIDLTPYAESADLATVATSGSYNDLSNKPTIPPTLSSSGNRVLVTDSNGAIVGSDVPATKLSDIMGQFYIDEDGDLCQL